MTSRTPALLLKLRRTIPAAAVAAALAAAPVAAQTLWHVDKDTNSAYALELTEDNPSATGDLTWDEPELPFVIMGIKQASGPKKPVTLTDLVLNVAAGSTENAMIVSLGVLMDVPSVSARNLSLSLSDVTTGSTSARASGVLALGLSSIETAEISHTRVSVADTELSAEGGALKVGALEARNVRTLELADTAVTVNRIRASGASATLVVLGGQIDAGKSAQIKGTEVHLDGLTTSAELLKLGLAGLQVKTSQAEIADTTVTLSGLTTRADGTAVMSEILGVQLRLSETAGVLRSVSAEPVPAAGASRISNTKLTLDCTTAAGRSQKSRPASGAAPLIEILSGNFLWLTGVDVDDRVNAAALTVENTDVSLKGWNGRLSMTAVDVTSQNPAVSGTRLALTDSDVTGNVAGVIAEGRFSGLVTDTLVFIGNARVDGSVTAATLDVFSDEETSGMTETVRGAQVTLTDAAVTGDVTAAVFSRDSEETLRAEDNAVRLINAQVGGAVRVVFDTKAENPDATAHSGRGNRITAQGVNRVGALEGFDTLVLTLSDVNRDAPVITVTGLKDKDDGEAELLSLSRTAADDSPVAPAVRSVNLKNRTVHLVNYDPRKPMQLIDADAIAVDGATRIESDGTFADYVWTFDDGGILTGLTGETLAAANSVSTVLPAAKTLAEAFLGSAALVNQGAEFVADNVLAAAVSAAAEGAAQAFGAVHGGTSRYKTGSRVDLDSLSFAAGTTVKPAPETVFAGFIEYGSGNSESHVAGTRGDGDHRYYGLGIALSHGLGNGFSIDGSARFGRAETEFSGSYAVDNATYESGALYASAHLGIAWDTEVTESLTAGVYGRWTVSWTDKDEVRLTDSMGSDFALSKTTAHAFRVGTRLTGTARDVFAWRAGLAWEHVADGRAESRLNGLALDVPALKGDTGIAELAASVKPSAQSSWSFEAGVKGYAGDREGVSGNLMIRKRF